MGQVLEPGIWMFCRVFQFIENKPVNHVVKSGRFAGLVHMRARLQRW
jgi:hypothetical protein